MYNAFQCTSCSAVHFRGEFCTIDGTSLVECNLSEILELNSTQKEQLIYELLNEFLEQLPLQNNAEPEEIELDNNSEHIQPPSLVTQLSNEDFQVFVENYNSGNL